MEDIRAQARQWPGLAARACCAAGRAAPGHRRAWLCGRLGRDPERLKFALPVLNGVNQASACPSIVDLTHTTALSTRDRCPEVSS